MNDLEKFNEIMQDFWDKVAEWAANLLEAIRKVFAEYFTPIFEEIAAIFNQIDWQLPERKLEPWQRKRWERPLGWRPQ